MSNLSYLISVLILVLGTLITSNANIKQNSLKSQAQSGCLVAQTGRTNIDVSASLCPGQNYSAGLEIVANDITLDCVGAIIDGGGKSGETGIVISSKNNVTLRNCKVKGFFIGVGANNSSNITIENGDFSGNSIGAPVSISPGTEASPVENLGDQNQNSGGGIQFEEISGGKIINTTARSSVAGVILNNSNNIQISGGNFSNNSGWGIKLNSSSDNTISNVVANGNDRWCHDGGITHRGCESASILLIDGSDENMIIGNQLNDSGDGFYINGNGHRPSNNNTIAYNTLNNAVNGNSIEATFSTGNKFIGNKAAGSNYAIWLGYSSNSYVLNNDLSAKAGAINIDHSVCNIVVNNRTKSDEPENNKIGSDSGGCRDNMVSGNTPEIPIQNCENTQTEAPPSSCNMEYPISLPYQTQIPTNPLPSTTPVKPTINYPSPKIYQPTITVPASTPTSNYSLPTSAPLIVSPVNILKPTTYNPQPTSSVPTITPAPTKIPALKSITRQFTAIWKLWSEKFKSFLQTTLP